MDPLREQAEKAKKYLVLRDELRLLEISVWLENLDTLKAGARKLEADLRAAEAERDQARADLDALYAEGEQYSEKMRQKDMEAETVRAEAAALEGQVKEKESAAAVLESAVAHNQENIERAQAELAEADSRAGGLAKQAEDQEARVAEIDRQIGSLNGELDALLERARAMAERAGGAQSEAEQLRGREAMAVAAAADRRAEKAAAEAERAQILERREAAERDRAAGEEQLQSARQEAKDNRRALEDARDEAQAAANIIAGHELRMEERKKKADEAAARRMQLTVDAQTLENRRRLLTEMEKEYEGFSKAVKLICQAQSGLRGIHGPVASLVKTDGKYSLAIEIALGAGLQNIVVDREEDAKAAIGYLKQRDGGRATFLPLTAIRGDELREKGVENEYGFVGLASRLVSFDPRYQNIVYNLLGRTVVAEDLDCGIAMARKYKKRLPHRDPGRPGHQPGRLHDRRLCQPVRRRAEPGGGAGEADRPGGSAPGAARLRPEGGGGRGPGALRCPVRAGDGGGQRRRAEDEVLRLEGAKSHFDILLGSLEENLENLTGELASLAGRLADNEQRIAAAQEEIERQESAAADLRARAEAALSGQSELLEQSGALTEEISAKKSALAALAAEREATARSAADLRALCADLSGDRAQKERTVETYRQNIADAQAQIEALKGELEALAEQGGAFRDRLAAINGEKNALEAERTARNRAGQEMNEHLLDLERAAAKLDQRRATSAMEEKQILDRLWEHYELSHSAAQAQRIELESLPKANRRIGELKRDISALGTPNIGAIEEFDRVNTRYTYLTDQRNDVEKAKGELERIIGDITGEMTKIFAEQFKLLSESFQTTFRELFGGGDARLELEDEEDILGCGIEIKAQPPGKTLKTISLLSGGEKAFVAIALYFAILKVHPTPFCVMDEIEAALDDANVTRYARYMRQLTGKTQFIVITHRRGTMEEADVLYGVTRSARLLSKILTINLNDMAKELKIK